MMCSKCTARVERALLAVPGVAGADADLASGVVTVDAAPGTQAAALAGVVTDMGFPAAPAE